MSKEYGRKKAYRGEEIQTWELEMVIKVSRAFRTDEHDELEAELAGKLVELKYRMPSGIRNWKAYLAKFLYNKASNWVRNSRRRGRLEFSLRRDRGPMLISKAHSVEEQEHDLRIALAQLRPELHPELRRFWDLLLQKRGNRSKAARQAGIHRNTARLWLLEIQQLLQRHGF